MKAGQDMAPGRPFFFDIEAERSAFLLLSFLLMLPDGGDGSNQKIDAREDSECS